MPSRCLRAVASFAAGLVVVLSLSAVSPQLHQWLHEQGQDHSSLPCPHQSGQASDSTAPAHDSDDAESHRCAVSLFSHGIVSPAAALFTQPCEGILRAINRRAFEQLALAQPRFLHLPPQAPPAV